jgi:hypothetical protein
MNDTPEPQPSRPTFGYGAPDLGLGWNWASPEGRPAAWQAFGEDDTTEDPE